MNLTITVQAELLERARARALEDETTVNAVLRKFLESYAHATRQRRAAEKLLALSRTAQARRGATTWTRAELHDR